MVPKAFAFEKMQIHFNEPTIQRGYTAEFQKEEKQDWGNFRLAVLPDLVNEPIDLEMKEFSCGELPMPDGLQPLGGCYIYDIRRQDQENKDPLLLQKPFYLSIKLDAIANYFRKKIYYWNSIKEQWVVLPSSVDFDNGYVRAITHLPFSRLAVFEDSASQPGREVEGVASWYRDSRNPYGAASNDYPLGTLLEVKNVDDGSTVTVEVTSTGPFHPFSDRRVLDLTLPAFQQIEEQWRGVARVQIRPLYGAGVILGESITMPQNERVNQEAAIPEPVVNAAAAIAINESNNKILYSKNYDQVRPIASLTKLMTAAVFLETNTPMDAVVTYQAADNAIGSKLYVSPGETMTVKDIFYTMLVGSANNAANALARSTGLTREEFVARMNAKAADWGLEHTHFADVSGLDTENKSTVYEIAKLASHVLQDFRILQGTTTPAYGFRTINTDSPHTIKSSAKGVYNGTVDSALYITGMKTGYLDEAGYCFMLKARSDKESTNHVITVVLGAETNIQRYNETNELMHYGLSKI